MGFESMWFVNNMGSFGIIILFTPLLYLITPLLSCFSTKGRYRLAKLKSFITRSLYWALPLRTMIEAYIIIALCSLINFRSLNWTDKWE